VRVTFDDLPPGRCFPLTRAEAKRTIEEITPDEILSRLKSLHFGCNRKTTQEARLVERGNSVELRLNFWTESGQSRVLAMTRQWLDPVRRAGGILTADGFVEWPAGSARRYGAFLLAHEIAHLVYARDHGSLGAMGRKSSPQEERWCDRWAESHALQLW